MENNQVDLSRVHTHLKELFSWVPMTYMSAACSYEVPSLHIVLEQKLDIQVWVEYKFSILSNGEEKHTKANRFTYFIFSWCKAWL